MYYAHASDDGRYQTILEHLFGVSERANAFSVPFLRSMAHAVSMGHDIGKYADDFQARLKGSTKPFSHAICGALEYQKILSKSSSLGIFAPMIESCIAGHHSGLPDGGDSGNTADDATLTGYLQRSADYQDRSDYLRYQDELTLPTPETKELYAILKEFQAVGDYRSMIEIYAFFTRYLFSCLTDADYLDTESFCNPHIKRDLHADFSHMREILDQQFSTFQCVTPLQQARGRLQAQAFENNVSSSQISILDMPTGSGKTLCSMKLALDKIVASKGKKKRIIFVIPYTSIIEQVAEQFETLFVDTADIVQHHSNYCFDDERKESFTLEKMKRATENWDAPVIITTSVQFFESVYHYRSSSLRKLHNLADSILIFDEVHMLPTEYLQPCLRAVGYITRYLNSEAIFLTATMPDYSTLFKAYLPWCTPKQLIQNRDDYKFFEKCRYENLGVTDYENIATQAMKCPNALIIVNTRKAARELYNNLSGRKYHLSTYMTPHDRSAVIAQIRADLNAETQIFVVSTSLIEAGVDLDFHTVFREIAGLDSILQSGGRCNREGKRDYGTVYVFETEKSVNADIQLRQIAVKKIMRDFENIQSSDAVSAYYNEIFTFRQDEIDKNTIWEKGMVPNRIPFKTYANHFSLIKDESIGVVIPQNDECRSILDNMKIGDFSAQRKLQRYSISLKAYEILNAPQGVLSEQNGVYVLANAKLYHTDTGLQLNEMTDEFI